MGMISLPTFMGGAGNTVIDPLVDEGEAAYAYVEENLSNPQGAPGSLKNQLYLAEQNAPAPIADIFNADYSAAISDTAAAIPSATSILTNKTVIIGALVLVAVLLLLHEGTKFLDEF